MCGGVPPKHWFFCEDSEDHMVHLCWLLVRFKAILGLKINLKKKNELIPAGG